MKRPPSSRVLATRISRLAAQMHRLGETMVYVGGFGPVGVHGRELIGAARQARTWAAGIKRQKIVKQPFK